jgi:hypothetical protein
MDVFEVKFEDTLCDTLSDTLLSDEEVVTTPYVFVTCTNNSLALLLPLNPTRNLS